MLTTHCNIRFTGGVVVLVIPRLFSEKLKMDKAAVCGSGG